MHYQNIVAVLDHSQCIVAWQHLQCEPDSENKSTLKQKQFQSEGE